jgi:hypothetical protein
LPNRKGCIIIYIGNCKACNPEEGGDERGKTGEDRSRIRGKTIDCTPKGGLGNNMEQMQSESRTKERHTFRDELYVISSTCNNSLLVR